MSRHLPAAAAVLCGIALFLASRGSGHADPPEIDQGLRLVALAMISLSLAGAVLMPWVRRAPAPARPVAALGVALLVLLSIEACLRLGAAEHPALCLRDPALLWRLKPGVDLQGPRGPRFTVNSLGFRGPEVSLARVPGSIRIVVLGDSALFGEGVDYEASVCGRLQALLQAANPGRLVEVCDLAVPGWTSFQGKLQMADLGARLHPDLVLAGFNNGPDTKLLPEASRSLLGSPGLPLARVLYQSHAYLALCSLLERLQRSDSAGGGTAPRVSAEEHRANLAAIRDTCRSLGIPLILVVMPVIDPPTGAVYGNVSRALAAPDVTVADVDADWRSRGDREALFLPGDAVHPNPAGHDRLARDLLPKVTGRLPTR